MHLTASPSDPPGQCSIPPDSEILDGMWVEVAAVLFSLIRVKTTAGTTAITMITDTMATTATRDGRQEVPLTDI